MVVGMRTAPDAEKGKGEFREASSEFAQKVTF